MRRHRGLKESFANLIEHAKGFILAAFVIVAVLGAVVGYRYYRYTKDNPQFCASCHLMQEAFAEWQKGRHRDIVCQQCHQLTVLEQNQLLVAYVVKGNQPLSQSHGRKKPWSMCRKCHMDDIAQGSITANRSYGHARHVFMQRIECKVCHRSELHKFHPNESACQGCHSNKGVHGIGMEAFSCLKCHSFSQKTPLMVPKDRCIKCHRTILHTSPMANLPCHQCHKPHGKVKPTASTCVRECHRNETAVGQHGLHMKEGLDCMYCHKPHSWTVGQDKAKVLCSRCHPPKDPRLFIY